VLGTELLIILALDELDLRLSYLLLELGLPVNSPNHEEETSDYDSKDNDVDDNLPEENDVENHW
jgi:hypothetical protein